MEWAIALIGVLLAPIAGYYGAQQFIAVAIARLEQRVAAVEAILPMTHMTSQEVAVIRSKLEDARSEIKELREQKHDVKSLKTQWALVVGLLQKTSELKGIADR
jgi:hypothetical protein